MVSRSPAPVPHYILYRPAQILVCDCGFESRLQTHGRPLIVEWQNDVVFAIPPACRVTHYVVQPSWWLSIEVHCLLSVATPPMLAYYSNHVINEHTHARLIWRVGVSEFTVKTHPAFLCSSGNGAAVPEHGSGRPPHCQSGILVSLRFSVHEALETICVIALLHETGFDMSLGYLANCWIQDVDWSRCS